MAPPRPAPPPSSFLSSGSGGGTVHGGVGHDLNQGNDPSVPAQYPCELPILILRSGSQTLASLAFMPPRMYIPGTRSTVCDGTIVHLHGHPDVDRDLSGYAGLLDVPISAGSAGNSQQYVSPF